jgi:hypothetical protein
MEFQLTIVAKSAPLRQSMRGNFRSRAGTIRPPPGFRDVKSVAAARSRRRRFLETRNMPAKSKAQQKAAGAALSAKRGETKKSELKGASREMHDSMSENQLEEFAETARKGLPEKKTKKKS